MKSIKVIIPSLATAALVALCGCSEKNVDPDENSGLNETQNIQYSAQSALAALKGFSDDTGSTPAPASKVQGKAICTGLAAFQPCVDGVRSISYEGCQVPFSPATAVGFVELKYNNNSCAPASDLQITRNYDLKFTSVWGQLELTSENRQDYLGQTIGGGGKLTVLDTNKYQIDILGQHRIYRGVLGREWVNFSVRTTQPVIVSGTYSSQNRQIESGEVVVSHNLLKAQAKYNVANIGYDNVCCYPISGQLQIDISGRVNRSGTINITGCGTATLTDSNGSVEELTFNSCD
ncbi:MAG: hypothetical protein H6624_02635 [Bdellovibrionaceae bacterium]|nr:hypothetical protein [Bdellovibrionales bacterium]MCB9083208.1 hypothetical protein [Pseudobdellovibrionaceae bacterium]